MMPRCDCGPYGHTFTCNVDMWGPTAVRWLPHMPRDPHTGNTPNQTAGWRIRWHGRDAASWAPVTPYRMPEVTP